MAFRLRLILLNVFVLFASALTTAAESEVVVAEVNGEKIKLSQLRQQNALEIFQARSELYELESSALKSLIIEKLIKKDPRAKGLTDNEFLLQFVVKPLPIDDQKVDQFIVQQQIPAEKINTNLKEQVRRYLEQEQVAQQVNQWYEQALSQNKVSIKLEKPEEPRFEVDISQAPVRGHANAPVTIIEFSDFECPYCARVNQTLLQLGDIYGNKVKVVYKHFPLSSIHPLARTAAQASICAQDQGNDKFWQMHDKLLGNFRGLSEGRIKDFANELGLDKEKFNQCLLDPSTAARVKSDEMEGQSLGVESTPAFFINGRFVKGALPLERFQTIIEEELAK